MLEWGTARVRIDRAGGLSLTRSGQDYLHDWGPVTDGGLVVDGEAYPLPAPTIAELPDEVELGWDIAVAGGSIRLRVRHGFGSIWSQRWVVTNSTPRPVEVDRLLLGLAPVDDTATWVFAAGLESSLSVQPHDPDLATLGMVIQRGELQEHDGRLDLGDFRLAPAASYLIDLRAEFFATPAAFARTIHRWLPPTTYFPAGEPVIITYPDAALAGSADDPLPDGMLPDDLVSPDAPSEFIGGSGDQRVLMFHQGRGRTTLVLHWAPELTEVIAREANDLLAGPRSANGAVLLPDAAAAMVVHLALTKHAEIDHDAAEDALDLWLARPGPATPLQVLTDCAEFQRTGDEMLLSRAADTFEGLPPSPGLGMAATRLVVAHLTQGYNPQPILRHLGEAAEAATDPDTWLELALVSGTVFGASASRPWAAETVREAARVSTRLGSGLLGRGLDEPDLAGRARLLTLVALLSELAAPWQQRLTVRPGTLAQHAANRVLWELGVDHGCPADLRRSALVWLSLAAEASS